MGGWVGESQVYAGCGVGKGRADPSPSNVYSAYPAYPTYPAPHSLDQAYTDALVSELAKEAENGRLLRLLFKLNATTNRQSLPANEDYGAQETRRKGSISFPHTPFCPRPRP
jgi:hypothetical protein